jgi:RNA polymerase sigma-70 factor (ECF subfamily)
MSLGTAAVGGAGDAAAAVRDAAWFDQVFTEHATAVHRYFVRRTRREDAEDLTAEVFATAWRRRDKVPEGFVLPWLYRTSSYVLSNHRRKPVLTLLGDNEQDEARHSRSADPAQLVVEDDAVRRALAGLSPRDRSVLMLHAWEGLDGAALAGALGVSRGGAAAALSRARSRLRASWESE